MWLRRLGSLFLRKPNQANLVNCRRSKQLTQFDWEWRCTVGLEVGAGPSCLLAGKLAKLLTWRTFSRCRQDGVAAVVGGNFGHDVIMQYKSANGLNSSTTTNTHTHTHTSTRYTHRAEGGGSWG